MRCPSCRAPDTRVMDSREAEEGATIRRRRQCATCAHRFTTVEEAQLLVAKRSGVTEPFRRDKVAAGVTKACQGRPVSADAVAALAQHVEDAVRASGGACIPSGDVGVAVLAPLHDLDAVAYLRYASVYRCFESIEDFEREIAGLRAKPVPPPVAPVQPAPI